MRQIDPTPEVVDKLCAAAAEGLSIPSCAAMAGVGLTTLQRWLAKAEDLDAGSVGFGNTPSRLREHDNGRTLGYDPECLRDLAARWDIAVAQGCLHLERRSDDFGERDKTTWTQPWTKLERMHRAYYGKVDRLEHEHSVTFVIERPPLRDELEAAGGGGVIEGSAHRLELPAAAAAGGVPEQQG